MIHKYNIGSQQNGLLNENKQNKRYCFVKYEYGCGLASGRFEAIKELAKEYSFLLDLEEIKN
jgi:protease II